MEILKQLPLLSKHIYAQSKQMIYKCKYLC
uniref:Uncharacterized protein n=1 Tax=Arundo donax TaxID=35708 RepID=A0A0A9ALZ6_ARUDO